MGVKPPPGTVPIADQVESWTTPTVNVRTGMHIAIDWQGSPYSGTGVPFHVHGGTVQLAPSHLADLERTSHGLHRYVGEKPRDTMTFFEHQFNYPGDYTSDPDAFETALMWTLTAGVAAGIVVGGGAVYSAVYGSAGLGWAIAAGVGFAWAASATYDQFQRVHVRGSGLESAFESGRTWGTAIGVGISIYNMLPDWPGWPGGQFSPMGPTHNAWGTPPGGRTGLDFFAQ